MSVWCYLLAQDQRDTTETASHVMIKFMLSSVSMGFKQIQFVQYIICIIIPEDIQRLVKDQRATT